MRVKKIKREKIKKAKKKYASIGGQAVMEGVMMRGVSSMAIAVRDEEGIIRIESQRITPTKKKNIFFRIPIIRGVVNFLSTLVMGTKTLAKSAEVYGESEPSKFEQWISKKLKINPMSIIIAIGMILGLGLSIGLFFVLPSLIAINLFQGVFKWEFTHLQANLIEGGIRLLIFISYLLLVSILKDIRRTFMYHGAEHRTINCYEKGLELTVENVQSCSTVHNRCGTTFLFFVMLISILVFSVFDSLMNSLGVPITAAWQKILCKIALLPLVAGLSYELLKLLALSDFFLLYPLKAPGMLLQLITTKKPTNEMAEVALVAFKTVMEMDNDPSISESTFKRPAKVKDYYDKNKDLFDDSSKLDWILCAVLKCKRDEIFNKIMMTISQVEKADALIERCKNGEPLQYVLGETEFYGYTIEVNSSVLIPRFDTEILADEVIKCVQPQMEVLDLCSGSGAIAVAIKAKTGASVTGVDISQDALLVAKRNAQRNSLNIEFIQSDLFSELEGRQFDVIVSNPPYIISQEIETLDSVVKDYEPHLALDGGADGLDFYRRIREQAFSYLKDNGILFLEVGISQSSEVSSLFDGCQVTMLKDLNQVDRILKVSKE